MQVIINQRRSSNDELIKNQQLSTNKANVNNISNSSQKKNTPNLQYNDYMAQKSRSPQNYPVLNNFIQPMVNNVGGKVDYCEIISIKNGNN